MKSEESENPTFETEKTWKFGQIKAKNAKQFKDQRKRRNENLEPIR